MALIPLTLFYLSIFAPLVSSMDAYGCDVYIDEHGHDADLGTREYPYFSIEQATKNDTEVDYVVCVGGNVVFEPKHLVSVYWDHFLSLTFKAVYWKTSQVRRPVINMHFISSKTEPMVIYDGVSTGLGGGVFRKKGFEEFLSVMITLRNVTLTSLDFAFRGAYGSLSIYDSHIGFESQGYVRSGIKASLEIANCTVEAPLQVEVAKLGLYESTISSVINNTLIYKNPNKQVDNKANDGSMTSTTATLAPFSWDETRTKKKQSLGQQVFFLFIVRGCTIYVSKSAFMTIYQRDASLFLERNKFILKEPLSKTEPHSLIYVHWTRDDLSYQHILSMYKNQTIPENVTSVCPSTGGFEHMGLVFNCRKCDYGYHALPNDNTCHICPAGTYAGQLGSLTCMDCPPGQVSKPGSQSCVIETSVPIMDILLLAVAGPVLISVFIIFLVFIYDWLASKYTMPKSSQLELVDIAI